MPAISATTRNVTTQLSMVSSSFFPLSVSHPRD